MSFSVFSFQCLSCPRFDNGVDRRCLTDDRLLTNYYAIVSVPAVNSGSEVTPLATSKTPSS